MKVEISHFTILPSGYGHWRVEYRSPKTFHRWSKLINDSRLIDATKNSTAPKRKDLEELKRICKS